MPMNYLPGINRNRMARNPEEARVQYAEKTKVFQDKINMFLKREEMMSSAFKREEDEGTALKRIVLVDDMLNLASNYLILSKTSFAMLSLRNEEALHEARKTLYKAVMYMEEVVSGFVDAPFSDYEERLRSIATVDAAQRYLLVRKLGLSVDLLQDGFGTTTKWRWAFVELEGRSAVIAKNILDLKKAVANSDPRSPDYEPTVRHLELVKKLLSKTASRYRSKYELSSNQIDDFKMGIHFLEALKRFHTVFGESGEAASVKRTLDIWSAKLEGDIKKQEEMKKHQ